MTAASPRIAPLDPASATPAARAVFSATRSMLSSNCARVASVLARTVMSSRASSEITFGAVPPRNAPTVISAGSIGERRRSSAP